MYSLATADDTKCFLKAKGVPKMYVTKNVRHDQCLHVLNHWNATKCKFRAFRSRNHNIVTVELSKISLSCIDDKRYLLHDAVHSLAYGYCKIPSAP